LSAVINGSDVVVSVSFARAIHMNYTQYAVPVLPNSTAPGSPAYAYRAFTFYRYATVNFSFSGGLVNGVPQNLTTYLMTPAEFDAFKIAGKAEQYVVTSGNITGENISLNFALGTWYFVATGWSVNEYRLYTLGWVVSFPGTVVYFS